MLFLKDDSMVSTTRLEGVEIRIRYVSEVGCYSAVIISHLSRSAGQKPLIDPAIMLEVAAGLHKADLLGRFPRAGVCVATVPADFAEALG